MQSSDHPHPTLSITLPKGWLYVEEPDQEVILRSQSPHPAASGFSPSLSVLAGRATTLDLADEQREFGEMLVGLVTRPDLEDLDVHDVNSRDVGYLRLAHQDAGRELITEAWCWVVDGVRWLVLATVDCSDYADYCDLIEDIVHSFEPPEMPLAS